MNLRKNGMKYREIERMTGVSHNTVILWVKQHQDVLPALEASEDEKNDT